MSAGFHLGEPADDDPGMDDQAWLEAAIEHLANCPLCFTTLNARLNQVPTQKEF